MNHSGQVAPGDTPTGFSIAVEPKRETVNLIPAGDVDIATVGQLQTQLDDLIDSGFTRIVIDLRRLEFIDSAGLHALVSAHARARQENWQLTIIPARPEVQRIFQITGADEHLPFTPVTSSASSSGVPQLRTPLRAV